MNIPTHETSEHLGSNRIFDRSHPTQDAHPDSNASWAGEVSLPDKLVFLATCGEHYISVVGKQGKSLLAEQLHTELAHLNPVVFYTAEDLDEDGLLRQLMRDFGLEKTQAPGAKVDNVELFCQFSAESINAGRKPVVLIDDAHRLKDRSLNILFSLLDRVNIGLVMFSEPKILRKKSYQRLEGKIHTWDLDGSNDVGDLKRSPALSSVSSGNIQAGAVIGKIGQGLDELIYEPKRRTAVPVMYMSVMLVIGLGLLGLWLGSSSIESAQAYTDIQPDVAPYVGSRKSAVYEELPRPEATTTTTTTTKGFATESKLPSLDVGLPKAGNDSRRSEILALAASRPSEVSDVFVVPIVQNTAPQVASARAQTQAIQTQPIKIQATQLRSTRLRSTQPLSSQILSTNNVKPVGMSTRAVTGSLAADMSVVKQLQSADKPRQSSTELDTWINTAAPGDYTLQMMGSHSEENIQTYIQDQPDAEKFSYFKTLRQDQPWYVLTWGRYANRDMALAAIDTLRPSLKDQKPWARGIASIQSAIAPVAPIAPNN